MLGIHTGNVGEVRTNVLSQELHDLCGSGSIAREVNWRLYDMTLRYGQQKRKKFNCGNEIRGNKTT
jgi:hypothetical protein